MMDDMNNLNAEINRVVEKVLDSAQLDELKETIVGAADDISRAAKDVAHEVKSAARQAQKGAAAYRPPTSKYTTPNYQPDYQKRTGQKPPLTYEPGQGWSKAPAQQSQPPAYRPATTKRQQSGPPARPAFYIKKRSTPFLVFGWICFVTGALALLGQLAEGIVASELVISASITLAGGGLLWQGYRLKNADTRYARYLQLLHGKSYFPLGELASATGVDLPVILKDIKAMMQTGILPVAYLNKEETCLMLDRATFEQYRRAQQLQQQRQREMEERTGKRQSNPQFAALDDALSEGQKYLRQIRHINDALPEEEISQKLDTLEETTGKIFAYVEQHPDSLSQIRKFMSYHLPTTLKLMEAYRNLEQHGLNTPEIQDTKAEIKGALDNINLAFNTLLRNLMQNDLMELSASVSALETMLAQDGLTGSSDFSAEANPLQE